MKLLPPKNKRTIDPKCCMTCKHCVEDNDGELECERDGSYLGDHIAYTTICDRYKPYSDTLLK